MLVDYTRIAHIYIVCGKTDLRRGIDGLATIVKDEYQLDVYTDALFLFCGVRSDRFKMLYWDGDGFLLLYKRLENGKLRWPRHRQEVKQLSQQLRWLLEGLKVEQRQSVHSASQGQF